MVLCPDFRTDPNLNYALPPVRSPPNLMYTGSSMPFVLAAGNAPRSVYLAPSPPHISVYCPTMAPPAPVHSVLSAPTNYVTSPTAYFSRQQLPPPLWRRALCPPSSQQYTPLVQHETAHRQNSSPVSPLVLPKTSYYTALNPPLLPSLSLMDGDSMPPLALIHTATYPPSGSLPHAKASDATAAVFTCSRCKKHFTQDLHPTSTASGNPKQFKMCVRCRALQRGRSRRWLEKTKGIEGACRRCGSQIPQGPDTRFVLCSRCRHRLRTHQSCAKNPRACTYCTYIAGSSVCKFEQQTSLVGGKT